KRRPARRGRRLRGTGRAPLVDDRGTGVDAVGAGDAQDRDRVAAGVDRHVQVGHELVTGEDATVTRRRDIIGGHGGSTGEQHTTGSGNDGTGSASLLQHVLLLNAGTRGTDNSSLFETE